MLTIKKRQWSIIVIAFAALCAGGAARAQEPALTDEIVVFSPAALRPAIRVLAPKAESAVGSKLRFEFGAAGLLAQRFAQGESADVVILTPAQIGNAEKRGQTVVGTSVDLARVGIGAFTKPGTAKPDMNSLDAFKQTLLSARSLGHLDPAGGPPSGIYLAKMLAGLDIAPAIKSKIQLFPANTQALYAAVVEGTVDLGFSQLTEILEQPGIALIGPLPPEVQNYTVFTGAVSNASSQRDAGSRLLAFLTSPDAIAVMASHGLERP